MVGMMRRDIARPGGRQGHPRRRLVLGAAAWAILAGCPLHALAEEQALAQPADAMAAFGTAALNNADLARDSGLGFSQQMPAMSRSYQELAVILWDESARPRKHQQENPVSNLALPRSPKLP